MSREWLERFGTGSLTDGAPASASVMLVLGVNVFHRLEKRVADVL